MSLGSILRPKNSLCMRGGGGEASVGGGQASSLRVLHISLGHQPRRPRVSASTAELAAEPSVEKPPGKWNRPAEDCGCACSHFSFELCEGAG